MSAAGRTRAAAALVLAAGVLSAAACGPRDASPALDDATAEKGRAERAFWSSYDSARRALAGGDESAARVAFLEALAQKRDHPASLYALAGIEHRAGRFDEALALCDRLLEVDRPRTRALLLRAAVRSDAEAALASGRPPGAWFDLARADADAAAAETENPEETGPHVARARIALLRGDPDLADACAARALTIHPGHAEAMVLRAVAARRRGDAGAARAWVAKALDATTPKAQTLPAGEGDTRATLEAVQHLGTARLRALAAAMETGLAAWPAGPPRRPATTPLPVASLAAAESAEAPAPLRASADFDGDGVPDELTARRAPERDALLSLFGVHDAAKGSFTLRLGGGAAARDATADSGLAGFAACVARLAVLDADGDGRPDVLCLPGAGDPSRREPPLLLRNAGDGRFEVLAVTAE